MAEIKGTKDVLNDRLKDKRFDYGAEKDYRQFAHQLTEEIPLKTNVLKTRLRKAIYNCLPEEGISKPEEVEGLAEKIYETTNKVIRGILFKSDKLPQLTEEGKEELEDIMKSYVGNLELKTLKKDFEEQFKQTGYIDADSDVIRNNILSYPVRTFSQKKQRRVMTKIEEKLETAEEFGKFQNMIKNLGSMLNKPVKDEDIWMPNKAVDTWMRLENIRKTLEKI